MFANNQSKNLSKMIDDCKIAIKKDKEEIDVLNNQMMIKLTTIKDKEEIVVNCSLILFSSKTK